MGRYDERIKNVGLTKRERDVHYTRDFFRRRLPESLSYKEVLIEGEPSALVIDKGTKPYYKKFRGFLEDQVINVGDYVQWADTYWLVVNADADHEIYTDGELYQCNYELKWQDEYGNIIKRWCHIQNASAYNTGEEFAYSYKLGTNELGLLLPIDEETKKLERDRRFYMDYTNKKLRYKFTRIDSVCDTFGDKGLLYIIAMEDLEHHANDNDELEICDYFEPSDVPGEAAEDTESTDVVSTIDFTTDTIKVNAPPKEFTAVFVDPDGNVKDDVVAEWSVESEFEIITEIDGNTILVSCKDKAAVGSTAILRITNAGMESSLELYIAGRY